MIITISYQKMKEIKISNYQHLPGSYRNWLLNQTARARYRNPLISNIQIHILQLWTIAKKNFMSHVAGFLDLLLIKVSVKNLKHCWRTNSFTYVSARVLKSCKRPSKYLIYNGCLCEFTHNLAISFRITYKKNHF